MIDLPLKIDIEKYLLDTFRLTSDERSAHILLTCKMWRLGCPLENDDEKLAYICMISLEKFQEIKPALLKIFHHSEENIWDNRLLNEHKEAANKSTSRRSAALNRWSRYRNENSALLPNQVSIDLNPSNEEAFAPLNNMIYVTARDESSFLGEPNSELVQATTGVALITTERKSSLVKELCEVTKKNDKNQAKLDLEAKVNEVFTYWKEILNHPKSKLDVRRERLIGNMLMLYPVEYLKEAIRGCANSPYNMGENDRGKVYDSIELIFRDAGKVDQFVGYNTTIVQKTKAQTLSDELSQKVKNARSLLL